MSLCYTRAQASSIKERCAERNYGFSACQLALRQVRQGRSRRRCSRRRERPGHRALLQAAADSPADGRPEAAAGREAAAPPAGLGDAADRAYKFTDKGPEKPEKGLLQPDTEYKRINLPLDADLHEYDRLNHVARYVDAQRQPFVVKIESAMTRLDGQVLDTGTIKGLLPPQGAAKLGAANGVEFPVPDDWRDEGVMWVCMCPPGSDDVTFYSSVCQLKQVHHSSFGTDGCDLRRRVDRAEGKAEEDQREQRPLPPYARCALSRGPASVLRASAGLDDFPVRHEAQGLGRRELGRLHRETQRRRTIFDASGFAGSGVAKLAEPSFTPTTLLRRRRRVKS